MLADCLHLVGWGGTGASGNTASVDLLSDWPVFTTRCSSPLSGGCMKMRGGGVILDLHVLQQKGEAGYVLLQGRIVVDDGGDCLLDYLLSRRLRPAMCCSKDLTPKPLLFLPLRAPSSLTGVDASCRSLQSCGEPRLLRSDLYWKNGEKQKYEKKIGFISVIWFYAVLYMCK